MQTRRMLFQIQVKCSVSTFDKWTELSSSFCGTGPDYCGSIISPTPVLVPTPAPVQPTPAPITTLYFADDIWPIIQERGSVHVSVPNGFAILPMPNVQTAYNNLVNKPSIGNPSKVYVKPVDHDNSYLIIKLTNGAGISGAHKPLGGPYLSMQQLNKILLCI